MDEVVPTIAFDQGVADGPPVAYGIRVSVESILEILQDKGCGLDDSCVDIFWALHFMYNLHLSRDQNVLLFAPFHPLPSSKGYLRMNETPQSPSTIFVSSGHDQFGEKRGLGINTIDFKVATQDPRHPLIIEMTIWEKGGPARHLHTDQEEWFYVVEGDFVIVIGEERFELKPGDSVLAPRNVPHVWAYVGDSQGKLIIAFLPAEKMETFFRETTKANAMPPLDPEIWRTHGMQLMGPPMPV